MQEARASPNGGWIPHVHPAFDDFVTQGVRADSCIAPQRLQPFLVLLVLTSAESTHVRIAFHTLLHSTASHDFRSGCCGRIPRNLLSRSCDTHSGLLVAMLSWRDASAHTTPKHHQERTFGAQVDSRDLTCGENDRDGVPVRSTCELDR